jgi:hypothetical protein
MFQINVMNIYEIYHKNVIYTPTINFTAIHVICKKKCASIIVHHLQDSQFLVTEHTKLNTSYLLGIRIDNFALVT